MPPQVKVVVADEHIVKRYKEQLIEKNLQIERFQSELDSIISLCMELQSQGVVLPKRGKIFWGGGLFNIACWYIWMYRYVNYSILRSYRGGKSDQICCWVEIWFVMKTAVKTCWNARSNCIEFDRAPISRRFSSALASASVTDDTHFWRLLPLWKCRFC